MLNTLSLICINSALYSSSFFLRQIARSLCFFESNRRCYVIHTSGFFLSAFVWQAVVSFR